MDIHTPVLERPKLCMTRSIRKHSRLQIRVPQHVFAQLRARAYQLDITMSALVEQLIHQYVPREHTQSFNIQKPQDATRRIDIVLDPATRDHIKTAATHYDVSCNSIVYSCLQQAFNEKGD